MFRLKKISGVGVPLKALPNVNFFSLRWGGGGGGVEVKNS